MLHARHEPEDVSPMRRMTRTVALHLAVVALAACPQDATSPGDAIADVGATDADVPPAGVTYHAHIRAVVERRCLSCHVTGGAGPFSLSSWEAVEPMAPAMAVAVAHGDMPPWPMAQDCRDVQHARALDTDELALFSQWQAGGFPEGDPSDYTAPILDPPVELGPPSLELSSREPYVASKLAPDDYRCFRLDHTFSDETFVTATSVFPDASGVVHHVIMYEVPADQIATVESLDAADAGPGYTCYGGPGVSGQFVGGWVPGMQPAVYPTDAALVLQEGSQLVVQIHYNVLGLGPDDPVPADQSRVALWTMPSGQRPTRVVNISPFAQHLLDIPAGDANVVATAEYDVPVPLTYIGVIPHMHTLGTSISVQVNRWDGTTECLTDVPEWDFNWQQYYAYAEDDFVKARLGDTLTLECVYDNSPDNQPVVNGRQQQPQDVAWGEGTLDEMCLNYLVSLRPYYHVGNGAQCDGAAACISDCPDGDSECTLACIFFAQNDCFECALRALYVDCAAALCAPQALAFAQCSNTCAAGSAVTCAFTDCATEFGALYQCFEPQMRAGACNTNTQECGFEL